VEKVKLKMIKFIKCKKTNQNIKIKLIAGGKTRTRGKAGERDPNCTAVLQTTLSP
jgi:hypothetical protein